MHRRKSTKSKRKSRSKKPTGGLTRWFNESWIDICRLPKIVPCGRSKSSWKNYPYCRPLKRISSSTPKTARELSKTEIKRRCSKKRRYPKKRVTAKKKRSTSKKRVTVKKKKRSTSRKKRRKSNKY